MAGCFTVSFRPFMKARRKALHGFGVLGGKFGIDDDGVAVKLDPVVRHQQHGDIVDRNAFVLQIDKGRER